MRARTITVTTTPTSLLDLLDIPTTQRSSAYLILEAPSTNTADILYGDQGNQIITLASTGEKSPLLPVNSLNNLYVVAASSQTLHILVFYR